ncbi:2,3-bisphosphoglycerate-independent phosphoglycerate mutase [Cryptococcus neoformans Tu401-1]|nr:2,3-bisphosphoglycerate-independent phosphoglycerate mutase [Cryptococcus neoformans var. grubii]OWZ80419.1 2,3-bisphosphoglycerate-independent phosphoglycerate mutase [Cryptococcus neoformans var. grubii Bt85]OXG20134.1 2,3-bisphosphoglycerate-independent phosphoglycerate mutase [Cryptococcus neoformans var. grubii Tu401-1]OXM80166.1 2,3-bisphosphoglycerate-independent phosphoglycerate mutase [Cryptococcus neoformans var. grubii Bt63]
MSTRPPTSPDAADANKKQKTVQVNKKVCLIVHDGWGLSKEEKGNAIFHGDTTHMDAIRDKHNFVELEAHGLAVGLKEGLMGNSEVGHLNIGAGRIVWQDIVKIDQSIKKDEFKDQPAIIDAMKHAKETSGRLHLLGLVSDGGVHSHIQHLFALLRVAKSYGIANVYIHFFGDGRDTAPKSATKYIKMLQDYIKEVGVGEISTVVGRYYAMDRDKRWERIKVAVDGLVKGEGEKTDQEGLIKTVEDGYEKDVTDEFIKPIISGSEDSRIKKGDSLYLFNYRSDRMREIAQVLGLPDKPMEVDVPEDLHITTMSRYNIEFPFPVAFPPQGMTNVLAEWLAKQGVKQCHIAETEKYAHVTFFFNGGVEKQFENEKREMIPSPKVATYDKQPEMSVQGVADKVAETVKSDKYEFVMCNFAPPDMVGHTGDYDAAVKAITATDAAVKTVYDACEEAGYVLCVTADHGNAEQMLDPKTGNPHTAHTTNHVPFIVTGDKGSLEVSDEPGSLADVAPTILDILGLPKPEEMSGRSLLSKK